ncbi:lecithin-cholesterol acyltransferase-like 4 [Iris pallida]|uniref:Lecithin-cholesterol acyltransferase-like 4 n=1 Tax=Iris pallida TaxID=29817 RepID=A0AAX6EXG9_IRIPA|nr:lecithin-cholesterol acyltransferase-like 4 [Iris pallida]
MAVLVEELIRSIELWLRLSKKSAPIVNPNLDPVILVPGIAGSILNSVDDDGTEERVWVRVLRADNEFRLKLWSRFDPSTGKTVSMDQKSRIVVPEDRYGLYAIDVLDPDLVIGQEGVYYYHDLIEQMIRWGYQEGKTLFGFGYDFRQSNRLQESMDRFLTKLESVYTSSGGKNHSY